MTTATQPQVFALRCQECRQPRDRIVPEVGSGGQQTHFFKCRCGHYNVVRLEIREGCVVVLK